MRHGNQIEWALHCVVTLASLEPEQRLSGADLTELYEVPPQYLAKALQSLARSGLVESSPGRSGGYSLAVPPANIRLIDIIDAVEGNEPLFRCQEIRRRGPCRRIDAKHFAKPCQLATAMKRAESAWRDQLARVSVEDILSDVEAHVPPAIQDVLIDWTKDRAKPRG